MMGLLGDIVGGIGSIASDIPGTLADMYTGGAVGNAKSVEQTNASQMALAQNQMDFQERMSDTSYQRAVDDMKKAGLNPALAYQQGGASAPTGAMAQLTAPRKGDVGAGILSQAKSVLSAGMDANQTMSQTDLNKANAQVAPVQAQKLGSDARSAESNADLTDQLVEKAKITTDREKIARDVEKSEAPAAKIQAQADLTRAHVNRSTDLFDALGDKVKDVLGTILPFYKGSARPAPTYNFYKGGEKQ